MAEITDYDKYNNPALAETGPVKPKKDAPNKYELARVAQSTSGKQNEIDGRSMQEFTPTGLMSEGDNYGPVVVGQDLNESRAFNQSTTENMFSSLAKAGGLTVSTIGSLATTLPEGIVRASIGAFDPNMSGAEAFSKTYDNTSAEYWDKFNGGLDAMFPVYKPDSYEKESLLQNMGTSQFWGETVLKNAGFTAGAMIGGGLVAKGLQSFSKIAMGARVAENTAAFRALVAGGETPIAAARKVGSMIPYAADKATQIATGAIVSFGEASMEAKPVKDELQKDLTTKWKAKQVLENPDYKGEEPTGQSLSNIVNQASSAGNVTMAANMALLTGLETFQFGRLWTKGFKEEVDRVGKIVVKDGVSDAVEDSFKKKAAKYVGAYGKNTFSETSEEGIQTAVQAGTKDYYSRKYDKDGITSTNDSIMSVLAGMQDTFGTKGGLESMLAGAITGFGSHAVTSAISRVVNGSTPSEFENASLLADRLTKAGDRMKPYLDSMIRQHSAVKAKENNAASPNPSRKIHEDENANEFRAFVQPYIETGSFDLLEDKLSQEYAKDEERFKLDNGEGATRKSGKDFVAKLVQDAKKLKNSWDAMQDFMPKANAGLRERMWSTAADIDNRNERLGTLTTEVLGSTGVNYNGQPREEYLSAVTQATPDVIVNQKAGDVVDLFDDKKALVEKYKSYQDPVVQEQVIAEDAIQEEEKKAFTPKVKADVEAEQDKEAEVRAQENAAIGAENDSIEDAPEEAVGDMQDDEEGESTAGLFDDEEEPINDKNKPIVEAGDNPLGTDEEFDDSGEPTNDQKDIDEKAVFLRTTVIENRKKADKTDTEILAEFKNNLKKVDGNAKAALEQVIKELEKGSKDDIVKKEQQEKDKQDDLASFNFIINNKILPKNSDKGYYESLIPLTDAQLTPDILVDVPGFPGAKYLMMGGRLVVIAKVANGEYMPFYQSSEGTQGKNKGQWYPFFEYQKGGYIAKFQPISGQPTGDVREQYDITKYYKSEALQKVAEYLNTLNITEAGVDRKTLLQYQPRTDIGRRITDGLREYTHAFTDTEEEPEEQFVDEIAAQEDADNESAIEAFKTPTYSEMDWMAATGDRTTADHQQAIDEDIYSILRYQNFLNNPNTTLLDGSYRLMVVTPTSSLYTKLLDKNNKKWLNTPNKDGSINTIEPEGIITILVNTATNNVVITDAGGKILREVSQKEYENSNADIDDAIEGAIVSKLVKEVGKKELSGYNAVSYRHFGFVNGFGDRVTKAQIDKDTTKGVGKAWTDHVEQVATNRKLMTEGKIKYLELTGISYGAFINNGEDAVTNNVDTLFQEGDNINDDSKFKIVIPSIPGILSKDRVKTTTLKVGNKTFTVLVGRPYLIVNDRLYPLKTRVLNDTEVTNVIKLFDLIKSTPAKTDAALLKIKQLVYIKPVYLQAILDDEWTADETRVFLKKTLRQIDKANLKSNAERGYGTNSVTKADFKSSGDSTYRDFLFGEKDPALTLNYRPHPTNTEMMPNFINGYLEYSPIEELGEVAEPIKTEEVKPEKKQELYVWDEGYVDPAPAKPTQKLSQVEELKLKPKSELTKEERTILANDARLRAAAQSNTDNGKFRLISLQTSDEKEDIPVLKKWWKDKFGDESFEVVDSLINGNAFGEYTAAMTKIFSGAEIGTGYHEAFHKVTQEYLTPKQLKSLYDDVRKTVNPKFTDFQAEEYLAEDFRKFMLSGQTAIKGRPITNSIFRKLYNYLRTLLTGKTTPEQIYNKLASRKGYSGAKKFNNVQFTKLQRAIPKTTLQQTDQILSSVNGHFFNRLFAAGYTPSEILSNSTESAKIIAGVYGRVFKDIYANFLVEEANNLDEYTSDEDFEAIKEHYVAILGLDANDQPTKFNPNVITAHKEYLKGLGIYLGESVGVEQENIELEKVEGENAIGEAETQGRSKADFQAANEENTLYSTPNSIKLLVMSLPDIDIKGNPTSNNIGGPKLNDYRTTLNVLYAQLAGLGTYEEQWDKLSTLTERFPVFRELMKRLGESGSDKNQAQFLLEQDFRQSFHKSFSKGTTTLINEKTGAVYQVDANANKLADRIKEIWTSNFRVLAKDKNSYVETGDDGVIRLSRDFIEAGAQLVMQKNVKEMLRQLGIEFTDLSQEDIQDRYDNNIKTNKDDEATFKENVDAIYTYIKVALGEEDENKQFPINDLFSKKISIKPRLDALIQLEQQYSKETVELSYLNAEGKRIYAVSLNNFYSLTINHLNNSKTLAELYERAPHLNVTSTRNSQWIKGLFDKKGNKIAGVNAFMNTQAGLKQQDDNESGRSATSLTSSDKIVQEINDALTRGTFALIRPADKAIDSAIGISSYNGDKLVIPMASIAANGFNDNKLKEVFLGYFNDELASIREFRGAKRVGANIAIYGEAVKDREGNVIVGSEPANKFRLFADILSPKTLKALEAYKTNDDALPADLLAKISKETVTYLESYASDIETYLIDRKVGIPYVTDDGMQAFTGITAELTLKKGKRDAKMLEDVVKTFTVNHLIQMQEQSKMLIGDSAFYKDKIKRISAGTGTKKFAANSPSVNSWFNSFYKNTVGRVDNKVADGLVNVVVFGDVISNERNVQDYINALISKGVDKKLAEKIMKPYFNMKEGDAQGWITLDEYREFMNRIGGAYWTALHEKQYRYEVALERQDKNQELNEWQTKAIAEGNPNFYFMPIKAQYSGPQVMDGLFAPAFHKYSLAPLYHSLVKGRNMEDLLANMRTKKIGYGLFGTGSKVGSRLNAQGKLPAFYDAKGMAAIDDTTPIQQIHYDYLGIQLDIAPKVKNKLIFGSQFRKLLFSNLFGEGAKAWAKPLADEYNKLIENQIRTEFNKLVKSLGISATLDKNGEMINLSFKGDYNKLVEKLKVSLEDKDTADNILDSLQTNADGSLVYPIDALVNRDKIEKMLFSIVNNKVIKQKTLGNALVQLASSGFEDKGKRTVGESNYLEFYTSTGPNGTTTKMQVEIPMNDTFRPLLDKYKGDLNALNAAIAAGKVDERMLTMIGYRIPTQGLNSMDVMTIKRFMIESSGVAIILPSGVVAKSGGDYDIDKLNIFMPNLKGMLNQRKGTTSVKYAEMYSADSSPADLYNAYKANKRSLSKELVAKVTEVEDKYEKKLKESMVKLEAKVAKARENEKALKKTALKDITLTDSEKVLLDTYRLEFVNAERNLEDEIKQLEMADEWPMPDTSIPILKLEKLRENYKDASKQLKTYAKEYLLEGLTQEKYDRIDKANKKSKEIGDEEKEEIGNLISEEIVEGKTITSYDELNTKEAVQNRILEIASEVLTHPDNFTDLVTPNTTDTLVNAADTIRWAQTGTTVPFKEWIKDNKVVQASTTRQFRFDWIMDQFDTFLGGKAALGVAATHNTHHILSQMADVFLNAEIPFKSNTRETTLTEEDKEGNSIDIVADTVDLSKQFTVGGQKISDLISQFINAYVDVANDPFYKALNAGTDTVSVWMYMIRAGMDIETISYFMTQPIIKDYVAAKKFNSSILVRSLGLTREDKKVKQSKINEIENKVTALKEKIKEAEKEGEDSPLGADDTLIKNLKREIKKSERKLTSVYNEVEKNYGVPSGKWTTRDFKADNINDVLIGYIQEDARVKESGGEYSEDFRLSQTAFLQYFVRLEEQASGLTELMQVTNSDTKSVRSFGSLEKETQKRKAVDENTSLIPDGTAARIRKSTIVGSFDIGKSTTSMYRELGLYMSNRNVFDALNDIANNFDKKLDYEKEWTKLQNDFIGYLTQKFGQTVDGEPIYTKMNLLTGDDSLARELIQLNREGLLEGNQFTAELIAQVSAKKGQIENIKMYSRRMTAFESNVISEAFRELLSSNNPRLVEFGQNLAYLTIVQSGLQNSPITFTELIPHEFYGNIVKGAIDAALVEGIDMADFTARYKAKQEDKNFRVQDFGFNDNVPETSDEQKELDGQLVQQGDSNVEGNDEQPVVSTIGVNAEEAELDDAIQETESANKDVKLFNPNDKEIKRGSVVTYNKNKYILWNIKEDGKAQLINYETGVKFTGTPLVGKLVSEGAYKTVDYNTVEYIVVAEDYIYSTLSGNIVYAGNDNSSKVQRERIFALTQETQLVVDTKKDIKSQLIVNGKISYQNVINFIKNNGTASQKELGTLIDGIFSEFNVRPDFYELTKEEIDDYNKQSNFESYGQDYSEVRALASQSDYTIKINFNEFKKNDSGTKEDLSKVLNHELIHILTVDELHSNKQFKKSMEVLMEKVRDHKASLQLQYGMSNVYEFVAEAMTNPQFQEVLAQIPADRKIEGDSIWTKFISLIKRTFNPFNVVEYSVLDATISSIQNSIAKDRSYGGAFMENFNYQVIKPGQQQQSIRSVNDIANKAEEKGEVEKTCKI